MNNAKLSPEPKAPLLKPQLPDKLIPLVRQTWIILCITDAFKGELYHLGQKYLCQRRWLKMSGWRLATVTVAMGFFFSIERNKASSLWKNKSLSLLCVFVCGWYLHVLCCLFTVHMSYCCIHVSHAYMNSIFILLSNALSSRVNFLLNLCMSPIHPHLPSREVQVLCHTLAVKARIDHLLPIHHQTAAWRKERDTQSCGERKLLHLLNKRLTRRGFN